MSKHYFGADLFSCTHLLSEIFVQIFAPFEFLRENARKLVRAKISTNKVFSISLFRNKVSSVDEAQKFGTDYENQLADYYCEEKPFTATYPEDKGKIFVKAPIGNRHFQERLSRL